MLEKERAMKLEKEINQMKIALNDLTEKGLDKNEIINLSQKLDLLIVEYYKLELKN